MYTYMLKGQKKKIACDVGTQLSTDESQKHAKRPSTR